MICSYWLISTWGSLAASRITRIHIQHRNGLVPHRYSALGLCERGDVPCSCPGDFKDKQEKEEEEEEEQEKYLFT